MIFKTIVLAIALADAVASAAEAQSSRFGYFGDIDYRGYTGSTHPYEYQPRAGTHTRATPYGRAYDKNDYSGR